jgi:hypothetical protein
MKTSGKKDYVLKVSRPVAKEKPSNPILTTLEFCDDPPPEVAFDGRSFCFTGIFEYENGDRLKCEAAVRARGGFCSARPTQTTNYIVLGTYADSSWTYGTFGKKILLSSSGNAPVQIVKLFPKNIGFYFFKNFQNYKGKDKFLSMNRQRTIKSLNCRKKFSSFKKIRI